MQIDIHVDGSWRPAADVTLVDPTRPSRRGPVTLRYLSAYAKEHLFARDLHALSVRLHLDARAITRVIHWDAEHAGTVDWSAALENLTTRFEDAGQEPPDLAPVAASMTAFGRELERLPELMTAAGVDAAIIAARRDDIARLRRSLAHV